jgi:hypothetical protein
MDSVRFGRALGVGARAAAKTLITAVDAATAPNPSKTEAAGAQTKTTVPQPERVAQPMAPRGDVIEQVTRAAAQVQKASEGLNRGGKQLQQSVWSPLKRLSGVLWLEFTGVFFGIFAVSAGSAVWKLRGALHETATNHDARVKLLMASVMAVLFTYFCVSSFLRARRRERAR